MLQIYTSLEVNICSALIRGQHLLRNVKIITLSICLHHFMISCVHLNMKVNRQTLYFLIKRTQRCPYYHSLYVFISHALYVFVSHSMYLFLTHSMYLSLRKERERERMGTKQSPSYNRIEDYYYTH
jgi:hypothetical protein